MLLFFLNLYIFSLSPQSHIYQVKKTSNPPKKGRYGRNTLMIAATVNSHEYISDSAENYNLDEKDDLGNTALMIASEKGYFRTIIALLQNDVDLNLQNNNGDTALILASQHGHDKVVKILLEKNPNKIIQNNQGKTALIMAQQEEHEDIVNLLENKPYKEPQRIISFSVDSLEHRIFSKALNLEKKDNNRLIADMILENKSCEKMVIPTNFYTHRTASLDDILSSKVLCSKVYLSYNHVCPKELLAFGIKHPNAIFVINPFVVEAYVEPQNICDDNELSDCIYLRSSFPVSLCSGILLKKGLSIKAYKSQAPPHILWGHYHKGDKIPELFVRNPLKQVNLPNHLLQEKKPIHTYKEEKPDLKPSVKSSETKVLPQTVLKKNVPFESHPLDKPEIVSTNEFCNLTCTYIIQSC